MYKTNRTADIEHALDAFIALVLPFYQNTPEEPSTAERWSVRDILVHLAAWIDYSHGRLKSILDKTPPETIDSLENFNRAAWEKGQAVPREEAYEKCLRSLALYRATLTRFAEADFERTDLPTGFDWPLWKYIYLDVIVHPASHVIYHCISRGNYQSALDALHTGAPFLFEFGGGTDSAFDLFELADDPETLRVQCQEFAAAFPGDELAEIIAKRHASDTGAK